MSLDFTETFLEERREMLRAAEVNGIDRVAVDADQSTLDVIFIHPVPGQAGGLPDNAAPFSIDDFDISGGDRIRGISVTAIATPAPDTVRLTVAPWGDFSPYVLSVDHPGLDPILREIRFGFRADCPSDFDCKAPELMRAPAPTDAGVNHLAKDYDSFRQTMLDRIAQAAPDHVMGDVADTGMALVELLALWADHLSYEQDAAATEAYLSTARRRASVRRHAQLLGYEAHDGLSARTFVQVQMAGSGVFSRDQISFMTRNEAVEESALALDIVDVAGALQAGVQFFEPLDLQTPVDPQDPRTPWVSETYRLDEAFNEMVIHDWGDHRAVLPKGATEAWIHRPAHAQPLKKGDFLSLELQRDPDTLHVADAELTRRQIICLAEDPIAETDHVPIPAQDLYRIRWHEHDALRFDLPVGQLPSLDGLDDGPAHMALAFGNLVPVDHGLTLPRAEELPLPDRDDLHEVEGDITALSQLDRPRRYAPKLHHRNISVSAPLRQGQGLGQSATDVLSTGSFKGARKTITLHEAQTPAVWEAVNTLLYTRTDAQAFVPETEQDGTTTLRFGGGDLGGEMPSADPLRRLSASYRVGVGGQGNVGADSIAHVLLKGVAGPVSARNPIPGQGGRDREIVQEIRSNALAALDDNRRAVTRSDYERLAAEHPQVARAHMRTVGHGSWDVYHIAIDPVGGVEVDDRLLEDVRAYLEPFRLMGQDIMVEPPRFAPLEIDVAICVCRDHRISDVRLAVLDRLSAGNRADGQLGFFHPDRLTFGAPIYLSPILAEARAVPGVADAAITAFRRWRSDDTTALENGVIEVDPAEIPVLMNDPSFPERGVLRVREWTTA